MPSCFLLAWMVVRVLPFVQVLFHGWKLSLMKVNLCVVATSFAGSCFACSFIGCYWQWSRETCDEILEAWPTRNRGFWSTWWASSCWTNYPKQRFGACLAMAQLTCGYEQEEERVGEWCRSFGTWWLIIRECFCGLEAYGFLFFDCFVFVSFEWDR